MKYLFACCLLLLTTPAMLSTAHQVDTTRVITISRRYDSRNWTNVTLVEDHFSIASDDTFYDDLEGELYQNYWTTLSDLLDQSGFWTFDGNNESDLVLYADDGSQSHSAGLDVSFITHSPILDLKNEVTMKFNILTGFHNHYAQWPIDMEIVIMESYPPQYGVSVKVIRGHDLLDVVNEFNTTLVAGFGTGNNLSWLQQAYHIDYKATSIAADGQIVEIGFNSFSMGSIDNDLNYSNAVFLVGIEELNISLYHNNQFEIIPRILDEATVISLGSTLTPTSQLNAPISGLILFVAIPIIYWRTERNSKN